MHGQDRHCGRRIRKPVTQAPPLLFDLTSLQREANSRFWFSAKTTLSLAQALYENTRCSRIREPMRARCRRITFPPSTDAGDVERNRIQRLREEIPRSKMGRSTSGFSTTRKSRITSPSSRPCRRPSRSTKSKQSSTISWSSAFLVVFHPSAEFQRNHAHYAHRGRGRSSLKARCWWCPAGWRCMAERSTMTMRCFALWSRRKKVKAEVKSVANRTAAGTLFEATGFCHGKVRQTHRRRGIARGDEGRTSHARHARGDHRGPAV